MHILGISAFYHDSAAAIVRDDFLVAAAAEERFSRVKHDNDFPLKAIAFCLSSAGISVAELEAIAYYEKPLRKFERILETFAKTYPYSLKPFVSGIPEWLSKKIDVERAIRDLGFRGKIYYVPHHLSHAAFSFYSSPFARAAILTADGVGEYATTALWRADETGIIELGSIDFPHSLGLLYSTITAFLGFRVNDDEYKVMGLAGHGEPAYLDRLSRLVRIHGDGSFRLNLEYFSFREQARMWSPKLELLLGPPRKANTALTKRERDIAASIQALTEHIYFCMLEYLHGLTGAANVCIGGGVALNATANGKIGSRTRFTEAYIAGPAGDDGAASGAALYVYHSLFKHVKRQPLQSLSLGSEYSDEIIRGEIRKCGLDFRTCLSDEELAELVSKLLCQGNIVGWFQGKMEYGPRALGNRSILADPRRENMKSRMNALKGREDFHPFAGAVREESAGSFFELSHDVSAYAFMTFAVPVRPDKREVLPALVHRDGTCRIQTVPPSLFHKLLTRFGEQTGVPCLLNTSLNNKGEPIVESPAQAINSFLTMPMDYLAIGRSVLAKRGTV